MKKAALSIITVCCLVCALSAGARERLSLDFGWRFKLAEAPDARMQFEDPEFENLKKAQLDDDAVEAQLAARRVDAAAVNLGKDVSWVGPAFDDSGWRTLDVPHDWAVELPFDQKGSADHGFKAMGGALGNTIGWYRRTFELGEADRGKALRVEFDGVYRNSVAWLNGHCLGRFRSGYLSFGYDITRFANFGGKNVLVVRVDASREEGWWYEGAGIYRHVSLVKTAPVHVAPWGTYVRTEVQDGTAAIHVETTVANDSAAAASARVVSLIFDADGKQVGSSQVDSGRMQTGTSKELTQTISLTGPRLWSLEDPHLYTLVTRIEHEGATVDEVITPFGVRTLKWDPQNGLFLNGKHVYIKGTCNHQDHAGVGVAMPDRLQVWRLERLKEMGSNAIRAAHNPIAAEVLDACDRMGILVLAEPRRMGGTPEQLRELEALLRRDRNHPSIIAWNLGNEEWALESGDQGAQSHLRPMLALARRLDPSRLSTIAVTGGVGQGFTRLIDIQGFNYRNNLRRGRLNLSSYDMDQFHVMIPDKPALGTEEGSTVSTRGVYANDQKRQYLSAYDINVPHMGGDLGGPWASTAESWWTYYQARPWIAGAFVWTGFDYRGEQTPFGWPSVNSYFGILDTCGFPKDNFYYYKAWWSSEPVLHVFPHWNWAGREGWPIPVWVHSNCDEVELFLNDRSLGRKKVTSGMHLEWLVRYEPGVLRAEGFKGGDSVLSQRVQTTGAPAAVRLRADRTKLSADGSDVAVITVEVVDASGKVVPTAGNLVTFSLAGAGRIIGVGNGDPTCHEADKAEQRSVFNGLAQVIVQTAQQAGALTLTARSPGLRESTLELQSSRPAGGGGSAPVL